jgi:hypothetical protein
MNKPVAKTLFNQWQAMLESGRIPVLEYQLDNYLQQIDQEITEGFLIPNNLI